MLSRLDGRCDKRRQKKRRSVSASRKESTSPGSATFRIGEFQVITKDTDPQAATEMKLAVRSATKGSVDDEQDMIKASLGPHLPEQLLNHPALQARRQAGKGVPFDLHNSIACRAFWFLLDNFSGSSGSQPGKQIFILCQTVGCLPQRFPYTWIEMLLQKREQLMPNPVA